MFSRFSTKFRSKGGSRTVSPQRDRHDPHDIDDDDDQNVYYSPSYDRPPQSSSSPQAPRTPPLAPPHLGRRNTSPLPPGKHTVKPSLTFLPVVAPNYDTDEAEENVSFAETLFPVTPSDAVHRGRRSSESSWSSDGRDGRDGFNDVQISRRGSWEYKRDAVESKRTSSDVSSKRLDRFATTMSDWTSSSVPEEEEVDSGPPVLPPYDDAEEDFLEEFEEYFNHLQVDHVRRDQYPKLELQKLVYLDYASFALFSNSQVLLHRY